MPESDLALLLRAARRAADVALPFVSETLDIQYKSGDQSPVTNADFAANAALEEVLREARPDYGWLSEESPDTDARQDTERQFVIDPIDGTRAFIEGGKAWAHALAVVEDGVVTTAVVYLPRLDKLYAAKSGEGATLNGAPIRCATRSAPGEATALATKQAVTKRHWRDVLPVQRTYRPSLAYRLCLVAEGRFDCTFTFRPTWEWDIACGALILAEAGALMTTQDGAPIRFNQTHPQAPGLLAANPSLHAALLAQRAPQP